MRTSTILSVMIKAAEKAGRSLTRDFGEIEHLQVSVKGPADFVSAADRRAEKIVIEELQYARPKFSILSEEAGFIQGTDEEHRFIIDPLDGTTNFLHGSPLFAVNIALEFQGELIAGVTHCPILNETFFAEKGFGCFVMGADARERRLRVSSRKQLSDCLVNCNIPFLGRGNLPHFFAEMTQIAPEVSGVRSTGSTAIDLAWVAAGRTDGYWDLHLKPWDICAGIVQVKEAGGFLSDHAGEQNMMKNCHIVAGPQNIQKALQGRLAQAIKKSGVKV